MYFRQFLTHKVETHRRRQKDGDIIELSIFEKTKW